jgi:hypothetical protein
MYIALNQPISFKLTLIFPSHVCVGPHILGDPFPSRFGTQVSPCAQEILSLGQIVSLRTQVQHLPHLKRLVAGFRSRGPEFETGSTHAGFVVDSGTGAGFPPVL